MNILQVIKQQQLGVELLPAEVAVERRLVDAFDVNNQESPLGELLRAIVAPEQSSLLVLNCQVSFETVFPGEFPVAEGATVLPNFFMDM